MFTVIPYVCELALKGYSLYCLIVHNGIYLKSLTHEELRHRLIEALGITGITVRNIYLIGPNDIRIMLTNNVVLNMKNESIYSCTIDKGFYQILIINF
jgi:hypothetical protein